MTFMGKVYFHCAAVEVPGKLREARAFLYPVKDESVEAESVEAWPEAAKINYSCLLSAFTVTLMDIKLYELRGLLCPGKGRVLLFLCVVVIIYLSGGLQGGEKFTRC